MTGILIETVLGLTRDPQSVVAWQGDVPRTWAQYRQDILAQARALPAQGPMVQLCASRYHMAVGLMAAVQRHQRCWLPPNDRPDTLNRLASVGPTVYGLCDQVLPALALTLHRSLAVGGVSPSCELEGAVDEGSKTAIVTEVDKMADAVSLFTSGSTGMPMPYGRSWSWLRTTVRAQAEGIARVLGRPDLAGMNFVATVPAQHSYGLESSLLLPLITGGAFDAGRPFYPADIVQSLHRMPRPRALVTTPFHLKTLLGAGLALPEVDLVLCATASLSPQLAREAERAMRSVLIEIYGCTEVGPLALRRTVLGDVWETLGELSVHSEVALAHADQGERYAVTGGHLPGAVPLADTLNVLDPRHFVLLGRANDVIQVAGKRSSLAHLNFHLNSIAGVRDGVCWMPPDRPDEVVRPVAFVVAPGMTSAQIVRGLRERLEPLFVPRRVVLVAALPREATGKLTAQALTRFAQACLAGHVDPRHAS